MTDHEEHRDEDTAEQAVVVPDELWDAAEAKAQANGQTISDVIQDALRGYVAESGESPAR